MILLMELVFDSSDDIAVQEWQVDSKVEGTLGKDKPVNFKIRQHYIVCALAQGQPAKHETKSASDK